MEDFNFQCLETLIQIRK